MRLLMRFKSIFYLIFFLLLTPVYGYKWIQTNWSGGTNSSVTYVYTNNNHNEFYSIVPVNYTSFPVQYFYTNNGLEIRCRMTNSMSLYLHFDEPGNELKAWDRYGNQINEDQTFFGIYSAGSVKPYLSTTEYHNGGGAMYVDDGSKSCLALTTNSATGTKDILLNAVNPTNGTIEVWIKPVTNFTGKMSGHLTRYMFSFWDPASGGLRTGFWIKGVTNTGVDPDFYHSVRHNWNGAVNSTTSYNSVEWFHIALVYRGDGTADLYINGVKLANSWSGGSTTDFHFEDLIIGNQAQSYGWLPSANAGFCYFDEFMWFNYAKSSNELFTTAFKSYALSSPIDMGGTSVVYSNIYWTDDIGSTHGGGNPVKFQIRTAPDNSGAPDWASGTKFLGPDGTTNTYYTNSGQAISSVNNNKQWLQYKIWFESSAPYFSRALKSVSITFEPPDITPPDSTLITNIISLNSKLIIQWQAVTNSDLAGYYLYKGTNSGSYYITNKLGIITCFTDTGLNNYQTNYYRICSFDTSSNKSSLSSEAKSAPHPDTSAPDTPSGFNAIGGSGQIFLNWNSSLSNDVIGYIIYKGTNTGVYFSTNYLSNVTNYLDSPVSNEKAYFYRIAAYDEETNISPLSAETVATAHLDPYPPDAPSNLVAVAGVSNVALHWTLSQSNDVIGYSVAKGTNSGVYFITNFLSVSSLSTMANTAYYTDRNVIIDKTYYYRVMAKDDGGNLSLPSNETNATPFLDNTPPDVPLNLYAESYNKKVFLVWSASLSNDTAGYRIYKGISAGNYSSSIDVGNITRYTDRNVNIGSTYYYVVTSYDKYYNESVKTNEINIVASSIVRKDRNNLLDFTPGIVVFIQSNSLFTNGYIDIYQDSSYNNKSLMYNVEGKYKILNGYNYYIQTVNSSSNFRIKGGETAVLKLYYNDDNLDNIVYVDNERFYESSLKVYKYSESAKLWLLISSATIDKNKNIVYAYIDDVDACYTLAGEKVFIDKLNNNVILGGGPNPFKLTENSGFKIYFSYEKSADVNISVDIFNVKGELIKSIKSSEFQNDVEKDYYNVLWDGKDIFSNLADTGIYFYILKVNGKYLENTRRKFLVIK